MVGLEHSRLGIDLDQPALRSEREVVARHLAERRADGQQHVGLLEKFGGVPILDPGGRGKRMVEGDRALTADGRDHRCVKDFGECDQGLGAAHGTPHPATGQDHRPLGRPEQSRRLVDELGAGGPLGDVRHHRRDRRYVGGAQQHVLGNLHPGRACRRRLGQPPRVGQEGGNLGGFAYDCGALRDVHGAGLLIVELMQHAPAQAQARPRHLAGDDEQWHTRGVRLLQRAQCGQRAGSRRQEQHADLAGGPGVSVGLEGRVVLDA